MHAFATGEATSTIVDYGDIPRRYGEKSSLPLYPHRKYEVVTVVTNTPSPPPVRCFDTTSAPGICPGLPGTHANFLSLTRLYRLSQGAESGWEVGLQADISG